MQQIFYLKIFVYVNESRFCKGTDHWLEYLCKLQSSLSSQFFTISFFIGLHICLSTRQIGPLVCCADLQRAALLLLPGELQVGLPLLLTPPVQITFPTTYIINISKSSRNSLNSECEVLVHRNYANQYNTVELENQVLLLPIN